MKIFTAACTVLVTTAVILLMTVRLASASDLNTSDQWGYNLSLYVWVPSVDGTLGFNNSGGGGQEVDAGSIIEAIQGGLYGQYRGP